MANKKRKTLAHEEIWDDTALIESWDEALQEYKLYHSIKARGERVVDVLAKTSNLVDEENDQDLEQDGLDQSKAQPDRGRKQVEDLEDGEVEEEPASTNLLEPTQNGPNQTETADPQEEQESGLPNNAHPSQSGPNAPLPQALVGGVLVAVWGTVQDEALKNLMMSWYYAGYYTGLYEGQQRAKREQ